MDISKIGEKIKPVNGQIVVIQDVEDGRTKSGLYLNDDARRKFNSGVIAASSDTRVEEKGNSFVVSEMYPVGTRIGYQKFAGTPMSVVVQGEEKPQDVLVMHHGSVTMIVTDDAVLDGSN